MGHRARGAGVTVHGDLRWAHEPWRGDVGRARRPRGASGWAPNAPENQRQGSDSQPRQPIALLCLAPWGHQPDRRRNRPPSASRQVVVQKPTLPDVPPSSRCPQDFDCRQHPAATPASGTSATHERSRCRGPPIHYRRSAMTETEKRIDLSHPGFVGGSFTSFPVIARGRPAPPRRLAGRPRAARRAAGFGRGGWPRTPVEVGSPVLRAGALPCRLGGRAGSSR